MNRFSRKAWFVCGIGLLVMLVAEIFEATHVALYVWGAIWVVGWIAVTVGVGMAVRTASGWIATAISIIFTILALYFAANGANTAFMAMSSISVIAVASAVSMVVQLAVGQ
jgi:hypothetical protein